MRVSEVIAEQYKAVNANKNKDVWGDLVFNVNVYGAKGNGIADDANAIQLALNAAGVKGGKVLLPPGVFLIGSTLYIPSNVTLEGTGQDISIIKIKAGAVPSSPEFGGSKKIITNSNTMSAPYNRNITIRGLTFDGNGENQAETTSIAFKDVTNLTVRDCNFSKFGKTGIYNQGLVVFGGTNVLISESYFGFCSGDGCAIAEGVQQAIVVSNKFNSNTDYGIAVTNNCLDVTVTSNECLSNGQNGIGVDECAGVVVTGNFCKSNGRAGIEFLRFQPNLSFPNDYYVCTGNVLRANNIGIMIGNSTRVNATANQISESTDKGIIIVESKDCTISSNDISNCTIEGILLISYTAGANGECGDNLVIANRIEFCQFGVRELASGGTIIASAIYANKVNGNSVQVDLIASKYKSILSAEANGVLETTNGVTNYDVSLSATTALAGTATLPANPAGFLVVYIGGVGKKIPYYNF